MRLIDADRLKDVPMFNGKYDKENANENFIFGIETVIDYINELPTELVRCKDCKHRPTMPDDHTDGFDLEFPDGKCPCQCDDGWYSWYPSDDWFCANGEQDHA